MSSAAQAPTLTVNTALFLDFDGTLVDLAAQPDLVVVPQGLTSLLAQERQARHQHLLASIRRHDVYWWRKKFLDTLTATDATGQRTQAAALSAPSCETSRPA